MSQRRRERQNTTEASGVDSLEPCEPGNTGLKTRVRLPSGERGEAGRKTLLRGIEPGTDLGRRRFLTLAGAAALTGLASPALAVEDYEILPYTNKFVFARLKYTGGDWFTDMAGRGLMGSADIQFAKRLAANTRIAAEIRECVISPGDRGISGFPFLYITGHGRIQMTGTQMERLRKAILGGATLYGEDCTGASTFRQAFLALMDQILPEGKLEILPMTHPLFNCLFRITEIKGGDKLIQPYMEGITLGDRLAVIYTDNDLGCAWEGHPCRPGGEEQRDHAFRLGFNIVTYAMTH